MDPRNTPPTLTRDMELLRWAAHEVSLPHDKEIDIPPQFNREEALAALERVILCKYSMTPLVFPGQGRSNSDVFMRSFELGVLIGLAICATILALYAIVTHFIPLTP